MVRPAWWFTTGGAGEDKCEKAYMLSRKQTWEGSEGTVCGDETLRSMVSSGNEVVVFPGDASLVCGGSISRALRKVVMDSGHELGPATWAL